VNFLAGETVYTFLDLKDPFFCGVRGGKIMVSFTHVGQYPLSVEESGNTRQPSIRLQISILLKFVAHIVIGSISVKIIINIDFIYSFYICLTLSLITIRGVN